MKKAIDFDGMFTGATAYFKANDGCFHYKDAEKHNESNPEFCVTSGVCDSDEEYICGDKCGACAVPSERDTGRGGDDDDDTKKAYLWWASVMTAVVVLLLIVGIFNCVRTGNPFTMRGHMGYTSENLLMNNM